MLSVKVSAKHQIAVPSEARRALGIQAGDRLTVEIREDEIALRRRPSGAVERLRGLGGGYWGDDPVAYIRAMRDEWDA
jgi:AbrB family looped-hinge helix DNA binding protein